METECPKAHLHVVTLLLLHFRVNTQLLPGAQHTHFGPDKKKNGRVHEEPQNMQITTWPGSILEANGSTQKTEKETKRLECGKARKTGQSNLRYKFFHTRAIARYQDSDEVWQKAFFFHHGQSCLVGLYPQAT